MEIETSEIDARKIAAIKIQKFWKGYIDKQVFKYYCKLINFKNQGDPSIMLKCINPKEIELFDAAFGARVKFRLGGEKFPPNIYFKVFTYRPIQDMCANSPKNYSKVRQLDPRFIHNKVDIINGQSGNEWYKRIENNGWRQVSDRMITKMLSDPVTVDSSNKPVEFAHDLKRRLESKKNMKKKRKLEWLKKIYNFNLLDIKDKEIINQDTPMEDSNDPEVIDTRILVTKAAESMIGAFDKKGEQYIEDWAVDELLDWTSGLSFDEYSDNWSSLATTLGSDWKTKMMQKENAMKHIDQFYVNRQINQTSSHLS